ncbi:hypothetical protein FIBSPDRAFT_874517 [Athelia psychrophila]|uniref:Uncharacterized protein n=1 Tax=Athelia psychrophila TaxID=1759441 RepID=A0A165XER2_9AGAM|nr:hypothetical protein FIBSPDRAFT_874517 [Fibularhizoctonia sp. CBS 109695]
MCDAEWMGTEAWAPLFGLGAASGTAEVEMEFSTASKKSAASWGSELMVRIGKSLQVFLGC